MSLLTYIGSNIGAIGERLLEHLWLVAVPMAIAIPVGVILGVLLSRLPVTLGRFAMLPLSLGQTIPSLAILALAMGTLGIGPLPAMVAILLYALLPIGRMTTTGIAAVPAAALDAARGMGFTEGELLRRVELPLALPFILTGIRMALVSAIGAGALAYLIGGGGLGDFIFSGIALLQPEAMLAGAIPTALLALGADQLMRRLDRRLARRAGRGM